MEIMDQEAWLPKDGFLRRYCEWTSNHEGPLRFQFWTGMTVLSAAVGRRYSISKGYYPVFPNLYTLLIAPSGRCRKTRTSHLGLQILRATDLEIMANKITPEELIHAIKRHTLMTKTALIQHSEAFIYSSELTVLLGKQKYNEGLIDLLTDWADTPDQWSYATRGGGKVELQNLCLVLLGCSTSEWLGEAIPQRAFGGGFLARILFIVADDTPRYFARPKSQNGMIQTELQRFVRKLRKQSGKFRFTTEGESWYDQWYGQNRNHSDSEDLRLNGYYERRPDHLLRVAMLLAISEERDLLLTPELLERSLEILQAIEPAMPLALKEINTTASGKEHNRIFDIIRFAKGQNVRYQDIVRVCLPFMSIRNIDESIKGLTKSHKVEEIITLKGNMYTLPSGYVPPAPITLNGSDSHQEGVHT